MQSAATLCIHSPHNEIINFTGVERTNTEINVRFVDNANVYMTKKTARWKISNDGHIKKINPVIKGSFTVSF